MILWKKTVISSKFFSWMLQFSTFFWEDGGHFPEFGTTYRETPAFHCLALRNSWLFPGSVNGAVLEIWAIKWFAGPSMAISFIHFWQVVLWLNFHMKSFGFSYFSWSCSILNRVGLLGLLGWWGWGFQKVPKSGCPCLSEAVRRRVGCWWDMQTNHGLFASYNLYPVIVEFKIAYLRTSSVGNWIVLTCIDFIN